MNTEIISFIGIFISSVTLLINAVLLYQLNKKSKTFEITVEELHELNNKMHDRLVDVEFKIKSGKEIPENLCKRLLYNSSRLIRHDKTINFDSHYLINNWTAMVSLYQRGNISAKELAKMASSIKEIVNKFKV